MKASEVIVTFSLSLAKHRRIAAGKNLVHGDMHFLFKRKESELLFRDRFSSSLRADEINLWLTPSAKQRRNPCSGLPAVYPDLSTRHDWPVKKGFVLFVVIANQVEGEFETHFR